MLRLVIGVAGPPGCGKSAFSALLAAVINARTAQDISCQDTACVVGMDGWHYPNSYLDHHTFLQSGKMVHLRSIKGAPETFDAQAMLTCLERIRQGGTVDYPVYSRRLHDPIPNGGQIRLNHRYVIVEGNYLFLNEPPWDAFRATFDVRHFRKSQPPGHPGWSAGTPPARRQSPGICQEANSRGGSSKCRTSADRIYPCRDRGPQAKFQSYPIHGLGRKQPLA